MEHMDIEHRPRRIAECSQQQHQGRVLAPTLCIENPGLIGGHAEKQNAGAIEEEAHEQ
jgi:hypothetical protein